MNLQLLLSKVAQARPHPTDHNGVAVWKNTVDAVLEACQASDDHRPGLDALDEFYEQVDWDGEQQAGKIRRFEQTLKDRWRITDEVDCKTKSEQ